MKVRVGETVKPKTDYTRKDMKRGRRSSRHHKRGSKYPRYGFYIASEEDFQVALTEQEKQDEEWRQSIVGQAVDSAMATLKNTKNRKSGLLEDFWKNKATDPQEADPYEADDVGVVSKQARSQKKPKLKVKTVDTNVTRRINLDE